MAFGVLVADGSTCCPVPFDVAGEVVWFHLARANPACACLDGRAVDLLVMGPHGYVSPTRYVTGPDHVPTWNHAVVALRGPVRALPDEALPELLQRQLARFEREWTPAAVSDRAMASMLRAICGFEMTVDRVEGKLELSQNRDPSDHEAVCAHLDGPLAALTRDALRRRGG